MIGHTKSKKKHLLPLKVLGTREKVEWSGVRDLLLCLVSIGLLKKTEEFN